MLFLYVKKITKSLHKKYDVIPCSYALFFLPDAVGILKNLVGLLKDDGVVIFTTFLEKAFSPCVDVFLSLLKKYGSSAALKYNPNTWDKLKREKDIKQLCKKAGITKIEIDTKEIRYDMSLDAWWELFNNTGFKGMLMELSFENHNLLKNEYNQKMSKHIDADANVELIADTFFVQVRV